jgi:mRNA interferase RelE/StbE
LKWRIEFDPAAAKEFKKLDRVVQVRIPRFLRDRLLAGSDPRHYGKALKGDKATFWRYKVGNYRLVCAIEDERLVILVVRVAHRRKAYR